MAPLYNTYVSGTLVRSSAVFTDLTGTPTDPGAVTVQVQGPTGLTTPAATKDSVGHYHLDIDTTGWNGPGKTTYITEWQGTGAVKAVNNDRFYVVPQTL